MGSPSGVDVAFVQRGLLRISGEATTLESAIALAEIAGAVLAAANDAAVSALQPKLNQMLMGPTIADRRAAGEGVVEYVAAHPREFTWGKTEQTLPTSLPVGGIITPV